MYSLFKQIGNERALEEIQKKQLAQPPAMHPIMKRMVVNVNANSYERVYACFRGEMSEDNVLGYIWILTDFDEYGTPQLTIKQWYIAIERIKGIGKALVFAQFLRYFLDIGQRCNIQRLNGGVMQKELVSFWRELNGFKGSEVMMEYNGLVEDFLKDNPHLFRMKGKYNE
jgi:hypothetical protein